MESFGYRAWLDSVVFGLGVFGFVDGRAVGGARSVVGLNNRKGVGFGWDIVGWFKWRGRGFGVASSARRNDRGLWRRGEDVMVVLALILEWMVSWYFVLGRLW